MLRQLQLKAEECNNRLNSLIGIETGIPEAIARLEDATTDLTPS